MNEYIRTTILSNLLRARSIDNSENRELNNLLFDKLKDYHFNESDLAEDFVTLLAEEKGGDICDIAYLFIRDTCFKNQLIIPSLLNALEQNYQYTGDLVTFIFLTKMDRHREQIIDTVTKRLVEIFSLNFKIAEAKILEKSIIDCTISDYTSIQKYINSFFNYKFYPFHFTILHYADKESAYFDRKIEESNTSQEKLVISLFFGYTHASGHLLSEDARNEERRINYLINLLYDDVSEIRWAAVWALVSFGTSAINEIQLHIKLYIQIDQLLKKVVQLIAISQYEDAGGKIAFNSDENREDSDHLHRIARMGKRAFDMMEPLKDFRLIGKECKDNKKNTFKLSDMTIVIKKSDKQVGNILTKISDFFHLYYREFEGRDIPPDNDESMEKPEDVKLFERGQGKRGITIYPLGWDAWELTCQYLDRWVEKKRQGQQGSGNC